MNDWKATKIIRGLINLFAFPAFIMLLWNWFMDSLFGLPHINYWEAFGLRILVSMLFHDSTDMYLEEIVKRLKND